MKNAIMEKSKMLKDFFSMKKKEILLKILLYDKLLNLLHEQKDFFVLLQNLYNELKSTPAEELKDQLILKAAQLLSKQVE